MIDAHTLIIYLEQTVGVHDGEVLLNQLGITPVDNEVQVAQLNKVFAHEMLLHDATPMTLVVWHLCAHEMLYLR